MRRDSTSTCQVLTRVNNIHERDISDSSFEQRWKHIQTSADKQTLRKKKKKKHKRVKEERRGKEKIKRVKKRNEETETSKMFEKCISLS